jgi:hypothetical protein
LICGILNIGKARHWTVTPKFARQTHVDDDAGLLSGATTPRTACDDDDTKSISSTGTLAMDLQMTAITTTQSTDSLTDLFADSKQDRIDGSISACAADQISGTKVDFVMVDLISDSNPGLSTAYKSVKTVNLHWPELVMAAYLFVCALYGMLMRQYGIGLFSLLNGGAYLVIGLGQLGRLK